MCYYCTHLTLYIYRKSAKALSNLDKVLQYICIHFFLLPTTNMYFLFLKMTFGLNTLKRAYVLYTYNELKTLLLLYEYVITAAQCFQPKFRMMQK